MYIDRDSSWKLPPPSHDGGFPWALLLLLQWQKEKALMHENLLGKAAAAAPPMSQVLQPSILKKYTHVSLTSKEERKECCQSDNNAN